MKTDVILKSDVLDELEWEPSVNSTGIGVAVKDGVVTLSGEVASCVSRASRAPQMRSRFTFPARAIARTRTSLARPWLH